GRGGVAEQDYTITVTLNANRYPPYFTSTPVVDANVATPYTYQATATETGLESLTSLTFTVVSGPSNLTINASTGLVSWTPTTAHAGATAAPPRLTDAPTPPAPQSFSTFAPQAPGTPPPMIVSTPVTATIVNHRYLYPVVAVDPDNDPLTYALLINPTG